MRNLSPFFLACAVLIARPLAAEGPASTAAVDPILDEVSAAIGAGGVRSFRFHASGSSYEHIPGEAGAVERRYARVNEYVHEVDVDERRATVEITRTVDEVRTSETRSAGPSDAWDAQLAVWLNPYVFLREAMTRNAESAPDEVYAQPYTRIWFEGPAGHVVEGYVPAEGEPRLERIRTWVDDPDGAAAVPIEVTFRFYEETEAGALFPGLLVVKRDDQLEQVLSVQKVWIDSGA